MAESFKLPDRDFQTPRETFAADANIANWLRFLNPSYPSFGQQEPPAAYKRAGLVAYADGVNWNPGANGVAGYYWWTGVAWLPFSPTPTPFPPIFDFTVTNSAVTSITTNGTITLDGNAHGGYEFEFIIVNSSGSAAIYRLYANNDTTNTDYFVLQEGTSGVNDARLFDSMANGNTMFVQRGILSISPAGNIVSTHSLSDFNRIQYAAVGWEWQKLATVANLTRIDIVSSITNGIGINSLFRLWRRK